jgi:hypothetical protein
MQPAPLYRTVGSSGGGGAQHQEGSQQVGGGGGGGPSPLLPLGQGPLPPGAHASIPRAAAYASGFSGNARMDSGSGSGSGSGGSGGGSGAMLTQTGRDKNGIRYGPEAYAPLLVVGVLGRRPLAADGHGDASGDDAAWIKGWARRHILGEGSVGDADIVDVDELLADPPGGREVSAADAPSLPLGSSGTIGQLFCRGRHVLVLCAETDDEPVDERLSEPAEARKFAGGVSREQRAMRLADWRNMFFLFSVCHEVVVIQSLDSFDEGFHCSALDMLRVRQLRALDTTKRAVGSQLVSALNEALAPHPDVKISTLAPGKVVPRLSIAIETNSRISPRTLLQLESDARVLLPCFGPSIPFKAPPTDSSGAFVLFHTGRTDPSAERDSVAFVFGVPTSASPADPLGLRLERVRLDETDRLGSSSQGVVLPVITRAEAAYSPRPGTERGSRFSQSPLPATKAWCIAAAAISRLILSPHDGPAKSGKTKGSSQFVTERLKSAFDPELALSQQRCHVGLTAARAAMTSFFRQVQRDLPAKPSRGRKGAPVDDDGEAHTHSSSCVCVNGARDAWKTVERELGIAGATGAALPGTKHKLFREWRTQWGDPVVQIVDLKLPLDVLESVPQKAHTVGRRSNRTEKWVLRRYCPCGVQRVDTVSNEVAINEAAMKACESCSADEYVWLTEAERRRGWHIALAPVTRPSGSSHGAAPLLNSELDFECSFGHCQRLPGPLSSLDRAIPLHRACSSCSSDESRTAAQLRRVLLSTPPLSKGLLRAFPRIRVTREEGAPSHGSTTVRLSDVVTLPPGQRVAIQIPLAHDPNGAFGSSAVRREELDNRLVKVVLQGVLVDGPL